jgi:hypothetical protein
MDRPVPGVKARQRFHLVASSHLRCHTARHAALCQDGIAKMTAPIGTVGENLARIVRQACAPTLPSLTLAGVIATAHRRPLLGRVLHFCSGKPLQNLAGVDTRASRRTVRLAGGGDGGRNVRERLALHRRCNGCTKYNDEPPMSTNTREHTAYHEAAYAVIGRVLGLVWGEATIKSNATGTNDESLGYACIEDPVRHWQREIGSRRQRTDAFYMASYAGAEAEKIILGEESAFGDVDDQDRATACLALAGGVPRVQ